MPRKQHIVSTEYPYHVSVRTNNKDWFELSMEEVWSIASNYLYSAKHIFGLEIHAFVLMSNHFHLLVSTPQGNLSEAMQFINGSISREISRRQKRINHNFKQRYFRSLIKDPRHLHTVYKYILLNPVRAGISKFAHSYRYSTLHCCLGLGHGMIPVNDIILFANDDWLQTLNWINRSYTDEQNKIIQNGLKAADFALEKDRRTRRKIEFDHEITHKRHHLESDALK